MAECDGLASHREIGPGKGNADIEPVKTKPRRPRSAAPRPQRGTHMIAGISDPGFEKAGFRLGVVIDVGNDMDIVSDGRRRPARDRQAKRRSEKCLGVRKQRLEFGIGTVRGQKPDIPSDGEGVGRREGRRDRRRAKNDGQKSAGENPALTAHRNRFASPATKGR